MAILNSQTAGNGETVQLSLQLSGPFFPIEIHVPAAFAQLLTAYSAAIMTEGVISF